METSLKERIKKGKSQNFDFVSSLNESIISAQLITSFSNSEGGSLFVGIKENGKIIGINPNDEILLLENITKTYCKPPLKLESQIWQEDFRLVLEVKIPKNPARNSLALAQDKTWRSYFRAKQHTLSTNKIIEKIWALEKKNIAKPNHLGKEELDFLAIFNEQKLTLSKVYQSVDLAKNQIEHLLALFVFWGEIKMTSDPEGTYYSNNKILNS